MATFKGKISLDIRDSEPDWEPYLAPVAPEGSPNVLFIAWDDIGYGTMDVFGGPVETPTMPAPSTTISARSVIHVLPGSLPRAPCTRGLRR